MATSGFAYQGTLAGFLQTTYGTCPGCPPPPVLGTDTGQKGDAENADDRMVFNAL